MYLFHSISKYFAQRIFKKPTANWFLHTVLLDRLIGPLFLWKVKICAFVFFLTARFVLFNNVRVIFLHQSWVSLKKLTLGWIENKNPVEVGKTFYFGSFLRDALRIPRKYWEVFKTFFRLFLKYQHAFLLLCLFLGYVLEISVRRTREVKSLRNLEWSCTFFDFILV